MCNKYKELEILLNKRFNTDIIHIQPSLGGKYILLKVKENTYKNSIDITLNVVQFLKQHEINYDYLHFGLYQIYSIDIDMFIGLLRML